MKKKTSTHPLMKAIAGASFSNYGEDPFKTAKVLDPVEVVAKNMKSPKYSKPLMDVLPDIVNRLGVGLPDIEATTNSGYMDTDQAVNPYTRMQRGYQTPADALGGPVEFTGDTQSEEKKRRSRFNWGEAAALGLEAVNAFIPNNDVIRDPIVQPGLSYNPHAYGTGSQAIYKAGGELSASKAKEMLRDGTAHGKKLTKAQKRYFGMVAAGKADAGMTLTDPPTGDPKDRLKQDVNVGNTYRDPYYEASAKLAHFKTILNDKLKAKNPQGFTQYFKGMQSTILDPNVKNPMQARRDYVQNTAYEDYLSPDEVRNTLGEDYDSYLNSIKEVNAFNISQGQEPLYGSIEGEKDLSALNYGRRFASLQLTPQVNSTINGPSGQASYKRNYVYNPKTKQVDFTEEGDTRAMPNFIKPRTQVAKMKAGGSIKTLSTNPVDGGTIEFVGNSHADGGMDINYGGKSVEVEGAETAIMSPDQTLNIMGNMKVPGTNKKFKQISKELAKKESKYSELIDKGSELITNSDPTNKWDRLAFNAGNVMNTGGHLGAQDIAKKKQMLVSIQSVMLEHADQLGLDPISFSEGGNRKAKNGAKLKAAAGASVSGDPVREAINKAAAKYGIRPGVLKKLVNVESGGSTRARSSVGALGVMQFMPATAKGYGITESQLTSSDPKDIEAVVDAGVKHFKGLLDKNGGDEKLALAAYNGGQGAVDFVKKQLGKKQITGNEWVDFMEKRNQTHPTDKTSAWQNQTLDYVQAISGSDTSKMQGVRDKYYDTAQVDPTLQTVYKGTYTLPKDKLTVQPDKPITPNHPDAPGLDSLNYQEPVPLESNAKGLNWKQIAPELLALGNNKPEAVFMQSYTPDLYVPYKVTAQDQLNENTDSFNAMQRLVGNNPSALATLAAQKYTADSQALGNAFKFNQGIENDVTNKNVGLLNDAKLKNLQLADTQYTRQSTGLSKTKTQNQLIANSIAGKYLQNEANNRKLAIYENLYDYRFRDTNNDGYASEAVYEGPDADLTGTGAGGTASASRYASTTTETDKYGNVKKVRTRVPSQAQNENLDLKNQKASKEMPFLRNFNLFSNRRR